MLSVLSTFPLCQHELIQGFEGGAPESVLEETEEANRGVVGKLLPAAVLLETVFPRSTRSTIHIVGPEKLMGSYGLAARSKGNIRPRPKQVHDMY